MIVKKGASRETRTVLVWRVDAVNYRIFEIFLDGAKNDSKLSYFALFSYAPLGNLLMDSVSITWITIGNFFCLFQERQGVMRSKFTDVSSKQSDLLGNYNFARCPANRGVQFMLLDSPVCTASDRNLRPSFTTVCFDFFWVFIAGIFSDIIR